VGAPFVPIQHEGVIYIRRPSARRRRSNSAACPWPTPTQSVASPYALRGGELVQERDDEARAAHSERMAERDRAAVDVHLLGVEPSSRITAGSATRSLVQLDEVDLSSETPLRSSSLRTAGIGPMPITRGSTPATALPTNAPERLDASSRAFSSDAITSAAAPSLIPEALPAVTVPPSGTRA
jgi:hypothetical protein